MEKFLVDIPVILIFFTRDDTLKKVFEKIKEAKPSKLFLVQDGARRERPDDEERIQRCRQIVEDIDWECEVFKNYAEENMGCGKRVSSGISWAFQHVDRLVILEDDCVVEPTFFEFSRQLLEKYKDDSRVGMISALNHFKEWNCGKNDYFFVKTGPIAAWATWKRVWDQFDFSISDYSDVYFKKLLQQSFHHDRAARHMLKHWNRIYQRIQNGEKIRFWGAQYSYLMYKLNAVAIVPQHSLSCNIGVGDGATFSGPGLRFMRKAVREWFFHETRPMEFPLKHPQAVLPDEDYDNRYYKISYPNKIAEFFTRGFYYIKRKLYKRKYRRKH